MCLFVINYIKIFCMYHLCMAGLQKLRMLNLEGCNVTAACLESISGSLSLSFSGPLRILSSFFLTLKHNVDVP